jgi:prophage maintenance system killer protein
VNLAPANKRLRAYRLKRDLSFLAVSVATLSAEEVVRIHYVLCKDFAGADDPIGYGGVKSQSLLESAVGRQHAGFGPFKKYPDAVSNAATLTFGICCDHPFHNGNKRTALVSMLAHLDKNRLALKGGVRQDELYDLMLNLASRGLTTARIPPRQRRRMGAVSYDADHQVKELTGWLTARVDGVTRGERPVTYRQLRQILKPHGYSLGQIKSNSVEVLKEEHQTRGIRRREEIVQKPIGRIGYHDEGEEVSLKTVKALRRMCHLTEEDGCDTASFYEGADSIDVFVNRYRTVLRRLEKT